MGNSFDRGGSSSENSNSNTPHIVRRQQPKLSQHHISSKLNSSQKDLIKLAWETSKGDVSTRIYKRVFEKRPDLKDVFETIGPNTWNEESKRFAEFMDAVVCHLDDMHEIERLSLDMGRRHGQWKTYGFKSEFWVIFAESMTTECLYLDAGVHPAPDVLGAWATLISVIFGWVRDGYYEKLRLNRRLSRKSSSKSTPSSSRSYSGSRTSSMDDNGCAELSALTDNTNSKVTWLDQSLSVGQAVEGST